MKWEMPRYLNEYEGWNTYACAIFISKIALKRCEGLGPVLIVREEDEET